MKIQYAPLAVAISLISMGAVAQDAPVSEEELNVEEVMIVGRSVSFANNATSEEMVLQQTPMTSVLSVIDNLPGVLVNEGDTFGSDDWSTTLSIRGFQLGEAGQQLGTTIDGIANGNSNYGGGSKANRFVDIENLAGVDVSQGTADIASRSHEALGGTLNYTTINPGDEQKAVISYTAAEFDAQKVYVRAETGDISGFRAWVSAATQESTDFIDGSAEQERDHFAFKATYDLGALGLTAYGSYDDAHEDNYQRIYSVAQFDADNTTDGLVGEWTGIPHLDQAYRQAWSTLRTNTFAYLEAAYDGDDFQASANVYFHKNVGRGDWVPSGIRNVHDDRGGAESELGGTTYRGGQILSTFYFVDAEGNALTAAADCTANYTFPWGSGPEAHPDCYADDAIAVGSYRHTHYEKNRQGFNGDMSFDFSMADIENTLRAGVWYEYAVREESRDWHKVIDSATSVKYDEQPYWLQYERKFPVDTFMYYFEDEAEFGPVKARVGVKQYFVELDARYLVDDFEEGDNGIRKPAAASVNSDSDLLFNAGLLWETPVDGLEVFAGYAENYAALKDLVLESGTAALDQIEAETAENTDFGIRYNTAFMEASITFYDVLFDNRVQFLSSDVVNALTGSGSTGDDSSSDGIDFDSGSNGLYQNQGGIESQGLEFALTLRPSPSASIYMSYTNNDSTYLGTGETVETDDGNGNTQTRSLDELIGLTPGNTVAGSAEEMAVLSFDWSGDTLLTGISGKYVSDRWLDQQNQQRIDGYQVVDLYAGVNLDMGSKLDNVSVTLTVNNVFDESYLGSIGVGGAWLGAPRTAAINFKAEF